MEEAIRKADVLIEALSYIRNFRDKLTVIKLGCSAMEDPEALKATLQDVVFMETVGMRPILVHGGGKAIDRAMADCKSRASAEPSSARLVRLVIRQPADVRRSVTWLAPARHTQ